MEHSIRRWDIGGVSPGRNCGRYLKKPGSRSAGMRQLNKIGALGWWFYGKLLRRRHISKLTLKIFDKTVWILAPLRCGFAVARAIADRGGGQARRVSWHEALRMKLYVVTGGRRVHRLGCGAHSSGPGRGRRASGRQLPYGPRKQPQRDSVADRARSIGTFATTARSPPRSVARTSCFIWRLFHRCRVPSKIPCHRTR